MIIVYVCIYAEWINRASRVSAWLGKAIITALNLCHVKTTAESHAGVDATGGGCGVLLGVQLHPFHLTLSI